MKYLVVNNYQFEQLNKFAHRICKHHKIDQILIINLTELTLEGQSTEISKAQTDLGIPFTALQLKSSYQTSDYEILSVDWGAHTGLIYEQRFSHYYIPDVVPRSHNFRYDYHHNDHKLLCMLGKVRYSNRLLFWDSLIQTGNLSNILYSYYNLIPGSEAHEQQQYFLSVLRYYIRTNPDTWPELAQTLDIDLTTRVPGYNPDEGNLFYSGYPTHPDTYNQTIGSIVPETTCSSLNTVPFITEKTYRAIQNYHPFCVYGDPHSHEYLRSQGYETFDSEFGIDSDAGEIMNQITDSHNIQDVDPEPPETLRKRHHARSDLGKHLKTVSEHFINTYPDNYLTLKAKVEHNRYQWLTNVSAEQQKILNYFSGHELYDMQSNQPITNIMDYLYQNHHIYLSA